MEDEKNDKIVDFLFEVGMLAKTPRSGFFFLGSGEQSVAEHINRVVYIGFVLAQMVDDIDEAKVIKMCMFHDLAEARTTDLNYVHQKYTKTDENKVIEEHAKEMLFGQKIKDILDEYEKRETKESEIAKDADQLELLLSLKEQKDIGNKRSDSWIPSILKRLKTPEAKKIAETLVKVDSDRWWFSDKEDEWWVSRNKQK